ncbi:hypothetical protein OGAPHI_007192 [Ogataea philodendri]|uniref:Uncharacterized protein n=1 Tax=Ogataea philodendri TaxID=1378263 RepID=A0A9P8NUP7_9ASCO|nr:uncharacterized protein OGAPHI_007192 [Ogataea philodendri]KAH3659987.1 hypothetical protein OGAPHI_007192 [Ogataea philodendri]
MMKHPNTHTDKNLRRWIWRQVALVAVIIELVMDSVKLLDRLRGGSLSLILPWPRSSSSTVPAVSNNETLPTSSPRVSNTWRGSARYAFATVSLLAGPTVTGNTPELPSLATCPWSIQSCSTEFSTLNMSSSVVSSPKHMIKSGMSLKSRFLPSNGSEFSTSRLTISPLFTNDGRTSTLALPDITSTSSDAILDSSSALHLAAWYMPSSGSALR